VPKKCVYWKGKRYYWNEEKHQIEELIYRPIEIKDCPEKVLLDLLTIIGQKNDNGDYEKKEVI
jgi:hypothetical protein